MRDVRRVINIGFVALASACLDGHDPLAPRIATGTSSPPFAIVSDPRPATAPTHGAVARSAATTTQADVVYVSLQPGTEPNGGLATVRNTRTGSSVSVAMEDGGFDPVQTDAHAGDTVSIDIGLVGGGTRSIIVETPRQLRPVVVRTDPGSGRRDVPLNTTIVVVFSEPVSPGSIGGIQLLQGGTPVSGATTLSADGLRAEFTPAGLLAPNTQYVISIPADVADLSGDPLQQPVASEFTTGTAVAAASVATDQAALIANPFNGTLRAFSMSAVRWDDGHVSGTFSIFYPGTGARLFGRVSCFTIVGGKAAWIAGVVEGANDTTAIGQEDGWRVVDNGPPGSAVADQLSLADPLASDTLGTAQDFCARTPVTSDLVLSSLISGDIVVNGSGPPPPPSGGAMSRIALAAWPNGGIQVINADGLGGRILTTGNDWHPTWSPDGTKLAFQRVATDGSHADIYVISADGSGLRQLTNNIGSFNGDAAWSPDGSRIAFFRDGAIYIMSAIDGSGTRALTNGFFDFNPAWSPDGSRIAFGSSRGGSNAIYVMNADGTGVRQLTSDPAGDYWPSWSRDGTEIVFQHGPSGASSIYLVRPDGAGLTPLTFFGRTPSWSPDGRVIVFEQYGLTLVNADGSGMYRLGNGYDPAWSRIGDMPPRPQPFVHLSIVGGNGQSDTALATLTQPLSVRASRSDGTPVSGAHISWYLPNGGLPGGPSLSTYNAVTDASGMTSARLTLGAGGPQQIKLWAAITDGAGLERGVEFTATVSVTSNAPVRVLSHP